MTCEDINKSLISKTKNSFNHFAWEYFATLEQTQKGNTLIRKRGRLELICSYIGNEPISEIGSPVILEVLLDIQAKPLNKDGKPTDKAERCGGMAGDVFVCAVARVFCSINPASLIKSQLAKSSCTPSLGKTADNHCFHLSENSLKKLSRRRLFHANFHLK